MINSYDKEKFELNKVYWTYYFETSNKGNKIKDYTGIFQVKLVKMEKGYMTSKIEDFTFDILNNPKMGDTMKHNIHVYMNGYGTASCNFYDTYDECAKGHDKEIKDAAKGLNTTDRAAMYKKLVKKAEPKKSDLEIEATDWFLNLPNREKKYVKWIKEYYEEA